MRIVFLYNRGRLNRVQKVRDGICPREFFYGAFELADNGHHVSHMEIDPADGGGVPATLMNYFSQKRFLPDRVTGNLYFALRKHVNKLAKADCIIATTSGLAFAVAMIPGLRQVPLVGIHCGLLNDASNFLRRTLRTFYLQRMSTILFGKSELDGILDWSPRLNGKVHVCDFGVDTLFWKPAQGEQQVDKAPYFLSVGNDGRRDFATLLRAAPAIECEIKILTQRQLPKDLPDNVERIYGKWHGGGISDRSLRELYQHATGVLLPIVETKQPSGQSVALQAMACGRPVVITHTEGVWSRKRLEHGKNVFYVPPGDMHELAFCANWLLKNRDEAESVGARGLELVRRDWSIEKFAEGVEQVCKLAVSKR